LHYSMMI